MKITLASLLTVVVMSATARGAIYSNSFEYDDWNAVAADGWSYMNTNSPTISFPTTTQHTGASPTDGQKVLEIAQPLSGGMRKTILSEDVSDYVLSFDWYVLNPNSSASGGTGSKSYDSFFRFGQADGTFGIDLRVGHFGVTREIEPGVTQLNARALVIRSLNNGVLGPADYLSYAADGEVREARFFQDGWNTLEVHASTHPELGGDWLRFYLNGNYAGESNVNWFDWSAAFSTVSFGWSSAANPGGTNTNIAYFDNFSVAGAPEEFAADFDANGVVDGNDFLVWQRGAGAAGGPSQGDATDDGWVDGLDLDVWKEQFGSVAPVTTSSIPEPSALALALISSVWLAPRRCRRASRN